MGEVAASLAILMMASIASSMSYGMLKILKDKNDASKAAASIIAASSTKKPSSSSKKSSTSSTNTNTQTTQSSGAVAWPSWSSKITASVDTRVAEMRDALQNLAAGKRTTKQMTGSDGRVYFVVPNGLEDAQLAWLQELTTFTMKLYASALKRNGSSDVYTARLGCLVQDAKVSYINSNSYYAGDSPYTSLYPSGKAPPSGMLAYPYICYSGWWESIDRRSVGSALTPTDTSWKSKVMPYSLFMYLHEIAHATCGLIGHNEKWIEAWHFWMHEAEAAGLWSHSDLVKTLNGTILNENTFSMQPSQPYTWDPYTAENKNKCAGWAKALSSERGQQDNLWTYNPYYKKGLGCPCS